MRHWVSNLPIPPAQRWQSRVEILKEHIEQQELARLFELKSALQVIVRSYFVRKFDPIQPRVPAGNPDGGQWTSENGNVAADDQSSDSIRVTTKRPAAWCWNQLQIDELFCQTRPMLVRESCRSQAMERYAACITGKPLPPLPF